MGMTNFLKPQRHIITNDKATVHPTNTQGPGMVANTGAGSMPHMKTPFIDKGVKKVYSGQPTINPSRVQGSPSGVHGEKPKFRGVSGIPSKHSSVGGAGNSATKTKPSAARIRGVKGAGNYGMSVPR